MVEVATDLLSEKEGVQRIGRAQDTLMLSEGRRAQGRKQEEDEAPGNQRPVQRRSVHKGRVQYGRCEATIQEDTFPAALRGRPWFGAVLYGFRWSLSDDPSIGVRRTTPPRSLLPYACLVSIVATMASVSGSPTATEGSVASVPSTMNPPRAFVMVMRVMIKNTRDG